MSVQLAKSSGGNATPGRRTPSLSLNTQGKSSAGASPAGNKSSAVANTTTTEKNDKNEKSIGNNDNAAAAADAANVSVVAEKSTKNDSNQKSSSVEMKKDEILVIQENGHFTNGHKKSDKIEENKKNVTSESSTPNQPRESQRNRDKKQQHKKDDDNNKKTEVTTTTPPKSGVEKTQKKQEKDNNNKQDVEKKKLQTDKNQEKNENSMTKTDAVKKQDNKSSQNIEEKKSKQESVESVKKDENKKQESTNIEDGKKIQDTKKSGASIKDFRKLSNNGENLLTEKKIDDMEPLVFEVEGEIHGHPGASSTPGKVLKHRQGPLKSEEKPPQQQPQIIKDDLTLKAISHSYHDSSSATSVTTFHSSLSRPGKISGRRSIRNLPDISFENRYPGSYRQIPDDDRWTSSMNVTVGSEIANVNESTSTSSFSFFGRGKKRERTPPPSSSLTTTKSIGPIMGSQDSELSPKSPKRARLDFSGLFGMMTSPMTMLRQKFSRAKIQTNSTPNKDGAHNKNKNNVITCEMTEEEDVVNVSGVINDEITAVESAVNEITAAAATGEINDGDDDVVIVEDSIDNEDIGIGKDALQLQSNDKLIDGDDVDDTSSGDDSQDLSATSMKSENKKRMCNLM